MTEAQIKEVTGKVEMLLCENDVAVSALCIAANRIATHGWGLAESAANAKLTALLVRMCSELKGLI